MPFSSTLGKPEQDEYNLFLLTKYKTKSIKGLTFFECRLNLIKYLAVMMDLSLKWSKNVTDKYYKATGIFWAFKKMSGK